VLAGDLILSPVDRSSCSVPLFLPSQLVLFDGNSVQIWSSSTRMALQCSVRPARIPILTWSCWVESLELLLLLSDPLHQPQRVPLPEDLQCSFLQRTNRWISFEYQQPC